MWEFHQIYILGAVGIKDALIRFVVKVTCQVHDETKYGQKKLFGNFDGRAFKCQPFQQKHKWLMVCPQV